MADKYWASSANWRTGSNANERKLAVPGYYAAKKVAASAEFEFTGSNHGYGAVLVGNAANTADTKIHTIEGDIIDGNACVVGTIYDIVPVKIVADTGAVYALKKRL